MKKIVLYALTIVGFMACKKEVNVDLNNAASQIVIEGNVSNASFAEVKISRSVQVSSSNSFPAVNGAVVSITDNSGKQYELTESKSGVYTNNSLIGIPGNTYNLLIKSEGKEYTATSTMPLQVNLDTLLTERLFMGNELEWVVKPKYTDPAGFGNYYRFIEVVNGTRYPSFWVWDDRVINNGISTRPLIQMDSTLNLNDEVEVEMQCIDKNMFRYYTALLDLQQNMTTPANPLNNISGGAFGYFSAHTSQRKKVVIK